MFGSNTNANRRTPYEQQRHQRTHQFLKNNECIRNDSMQHNNQQNNMLLRE